MKKCEDCRQVKSNYDFYKRSDSETRRLNRCKACHGKRTVADKKRRREVRKQLELTTKPAYVKRSNEQ